MAPVVQSSVCIFYVGRWSDAMTLGRCSIILGAASNSRTFFPSHALSPRFISVSLSLFVNSSESSFYKEHMLCKVGTTCRRWLLRSEAFRRFATSPAGGQEQPAGGSG